MTEAAPAPLRQGLTDWQACVRAAAFRGGRALCAPELLAFGTRAELVEGHHRLPAAAGTRLATPHALLPGAGTSRQQPVKTMAAPAASPAPRCPPRDH